MIRNPNPEPRYESTHKYVGSNIDASYYESGAGYVIPEGIRSRRYELQFRNKMTKAGLEPVKVDILTLRFVYDMTVRDIAEELGVMSGSTVIRLMDEALAHLKKVSKEAYALD